MTKKEILSSLQKEVAKYFSDFKVEITETAKTNRKVTNILLFPKQAGKKLTPCLPIDDIIADLETGETDLNEAVGLVVDTLQQSLNEIPTQFANFDPVNFLQWDNIKNLVKIQVVNKYTNLGFPEKYMTEDFLDLFLVPYVDYPEATFGRSAFVRIPVDYPTPAKTVIEQAIKNTEKNGYDLKTPFQCECEPFDRQYDEAEDDKSIFYLSNPGYNFGAAQIACQDTLKKVSEIIGSDMFLVPCSINELMVCSSNLIKPDGQRINKAILVGILRNVNNDMSIPNNLFLSNNIYIYNRESGEVSIA